MRHTIFLFSILIVLSKSLYTNYQLLNPTEQKTIIFIHGLSDSLEFWNPLTTALSSSYRTLSYDLRGHGKSKFQSCKPVITTYEKDLLLLLKNLNIKKAVFVGFSMGSLIASKIAIDHPNMVEGLILMSTYSKVYGNSLKPFLNFENKLKISYGDFFDAIIPYVLDEQTIKDNKEALKNLKKEKAKTASIEGLLIAVRTCQNFDDYDELKLINTPTVIFSGENDKLTTVDMQKVVKDNVNGAVMIILKNTMHNVLIDANVPTILSTIQQLLGKIW